MMRDDLEKESREGREARKAQEAARQAAAAVENPVDDIPMPGSGFVLGDLDDRPPEYEVNHENKSD